MSEHTHGCGCCGSGCSDSHAPETAETPNHQVKSVIGLMSGKGGVGKSLLAALLAAKLSKSGRKTALLDGDILNPTIPLLFNQKERAVAGTVGLYPPISAGGVKTMSLGFLMDGEREPIVWPGPIQAKAAGQFWVDVVWDEVDHMLVDLPTGTGDVPQRLLEDLPLDGIIVVITPQGLSRSAAIRIIRMAERFEIPVLGLVENFSEGSLADAHPFQGEGDLETIPVLDYLPWDARLSEAADQGQVEGLEHAYLQNTTALIQEMVPQP